MRRVADRRAEQYLRPVDGQYRRRVAHRRQRRLGRAEPSAREHEPPPRHCDECRDDDPRIRGRRPAAARSRCAHSIAPRACRGCWSRRSAWRRRRSAGSRSRASEDSECERRWRHALLDATARQATLALYYSRLVDQSLFEARRQAVLEERNRIARDIHDTLAQGFGAILMQLQAAQHGGAPALPPAAVAQPGRPPWTSRARIWSRRVARSRRCVRNPTHEDVASGAATHGRSGAAHKRRADRPGDRRAAGI